MATIHCGSSAIPVGSNWIYCNDKCSFHTLRGVTTHAAGMSTKCSGLKKQRCTRNQKLRLFARIQLRCRHTTPDAGIEDPPIRHQEVQARAISFKIGASLLLAFPSHLIRSHVTESIPADCFSDVHRRVTGEHSSLCQKCSTAVVLTVIRFRSFQMESRLHSFLASVFREGRKK